MTPESVVLEGHWLYAGSIPAGVVIVRRDEWYGSGDDEDDGDVALDRSVETFEVRYPLPADPDRQSAGGGQYLSLEEARLAAEAACGATLQWHGPAPRLRAIAERPIPDARDALMRRFGERRAVRCAMARDGEVLAALLSGLGPWGGLRATSSRPAPLPRGSIVAGDDAAVLPASMLRDGSIVMACDGLEEDVHFREGWFSLEDLAWKALAVSLSDLAAMAAEPVAFLLALSWPEHRRIDEARKLGTALATSARHFECPLVGGDVDVTNGPLRLSVTVLGSCRSPLLRSGGQAGDRLFVSGPLGGAAFAVAALLSGETLDEQQEPGASALQALRRPMPRLDVARSLQGRAHAAIDLSDGLLGDARHLASASGLAAFLHAPSIPLHRAVPRARTRELALEGGEDYELLLAGPPELGRLHSLTEVGGLVDGKPGHVEVRT